MGIKRLFKRVSEFVTAVMCSCPLPEQEELLRFNIVTSLQAIIIHTT